MSAEVLIGLALTAMVGVIGYFLKTLITEARGTRETMLKMSVHQTTFADSVMGIQADVKEQHKQIISIIERLVRLEERTHQPLPKIRARSEQ